MVLAFATGALASGFSAAALTALLVWVATVLTGSTDPWAFAPLAVTVVAVVVTVATYAAEGFAHGRNLARRRATGEPWAYRED